MHAVLTQPSDTGSFDLLFMSHVQHDEPRVDASDSTKAWVRGLTCEMGAVAPYPALCARQRCRSKTRDSAMSGQTKRILPWSQASQRESNTMRARGDLRHELPRGTAPATSDADATTTLCASKTGRTKYRPQIGSSTRTTPCRLIAWHGFHFLEASEVLLTSHFPSRSATNITTANRMVASTTSPLSYALSS